MFCLIMSRPVKSSSHGDACPIQLCYVNLAPELACLLAGPYGTTVPRFDRLPCLVQLRSLKCKHPGPMALRGSLVLMSTSPTEACLGLIPDSQTQGSAPCSCPHTSGPDAA